MSQLPQSALEKAAVAATRWVGSVSSLVLHTLLFAGSFLAVLVGFIGFDKMLLILTTVVSLEAIYLAIFIQMAVNRQSESLSEVEHDIDEMQEDVDEIQEDIDEIQEDIDEMQEDVEELTIEGVEQPQPSDAAARRPDMATIHARLKALLNDIERLGKVE